MKPAILFLVATLAAAGFGVAVLKPAIAERDDLRRAVARAADGEPEDLARFRKALDLLQGALGAGEEADPAAQIRTLLEDYATADPVDLSPGEIGVETEFARLAGLLGDLEARAGAIRSVRIESGSDPERCFVVLTLAGDTR